MKNESPDTNATEDRGDDPFDHEAFVRTLCTTLASFTTPASELNLISLLTSGLMTWTPQSKMPLTYEQARAEAACLVLHAVTAIMIQISELTLDAHAPDAP